MTMSCSPLWALVYTIFWFVPLPANMAGTENETEVSFFNRAEYELFKLNPEVRFSFFHAYPAGISNCVSFRRSGTEWPVVQTAQYLSDHL